MIVRRVYIDPPSRAFYENRFFMDSELNRDECLRPYINLKKELQRRGIELNTFDLWDQKSGPIDYCSFGMMDNLNGVATNPNVKLKGFYIFEPPVVDPRMYEALPRLTSMFDQVYLHNTDGNGYSLEGADRSKLRKLFWPQPFNHVIDQYWENRDRERRVVVINGNHKPASRDRELYSKRIEAMVALAETELVDLYGRGWDRWLSRSSLWMHYWKNRKQLMAIYKGPCESKFEILSRYDFCLCFENMAMNGYMTEKLFDCLYAGTVPIYYGAPDVSSYIPEGAYIDATAYSEWNDLKRHVGDISSSDLQEIRECGRSFLEGKGTDQFYNSLVNSISL